MATAYQSCSAGVAPSIDELTPDVRGIAVVGRHPNGSGLIREITDLASLIRTHPYLSNYRKHSPNCYAVVKKPMIYDYGGKPYIQTDTTETLNFFRDSGTGSDELGIDCSGYVYSALATAGLKLKSSGRLKAIGVHGVSSAMFMNPQANGLTCLDYARFTAQASLKPGDILASNGHVLVIETVGMDPFGIAHLDSVDKCKASNIDISRFDFTILQSSPSKRGLGIHRAEATSYLAESSAMASGMIEHAVNACLAKFRGRITTRSNNANLVRHLGTAACLDQPVPLVSEQCIASCPANTPVLP